MDYFNYKERVTQAWFARVRDAVFKPFVRLFMATGVSPDFVSFLGVISLLGACILGPEYIVEVTLLLALYVFMDGLDGPLARARGTASRGGSLVDICADQAGVVLVACAAVYHLSADGVFAILFSTGYVALIALVIAANELKLKLFLFLRVKYPFYVVYLYSLHNGNDYADLFMKAGSVYYLIALFCMVMTVRRQLDDKDLPPMKD